VAALLADGENGVELCLIRRAERASDPWSGHMALPGGHLDPGDADLLAAAVRETREELGVELDREAQLLGRLRDFQPVKSLDLSVTPFIFGVGSRPALSPNPEVDLALWIPVAELASGTTRFEHELSLGGKALRFPAFRVGEHVVWGLTYRVVDELLRQIARTGQDLSR
jgi:8-oxo-dGTP pyrophosphatase MutT (NUDIX family)